jgi:hypothetical protein
VKLKTKIMNLETFRSIYISIFQIAIITIILLFVTSFIQNAALLNAARFLVAILISRLIINLAK